MYFLKTLLLSKHFPILCTKYQKYLAKPVTDFGDNKAEIRPMERLRESFFTFYSSKWY